LVAHKITLPFWFIYRYEILVLCQDNHSSPGANVPSLIWPG
jgi:hypothetical protein